jgi:hypothetical protein
MSALGKAAHSSRICSELPLSALLTKFCRSSIGHNGLGTAVSCTLFEGAVRAVHDGFTSNGSRFNRPHQLPFRIPVDRSAPLDSYLDNRRRAPGGNPSWAFCFCQFQLFRSDPTAPVIPGALPRRLHPPHIEVLHGFGIRAKQDRDLAD